MTIASGFTSANRGFAVANGNAYFGSSGATVSVPTSASSIDAGAFSVVAENTTPVSIAVDGANVYWTDGSQVMQVPVGGGTTSVIAGPVSGGYLCGVAIDSASVYWVNQSSSGSVLKAPIGGGAVTAIASTQPNPFGIATDGVSVYWTTLDAASSGRVLKAPVGGGAATTLASGPNQPQRVATDGANVYWTAVSTTAADGVVMKVTVNGGTPTTLASGRVYPEYIAIDAKYVYWIDTGSVVAGDGGGASPSMVVAVPIDGGSPITLATGSSNTIEGIAVDAASVYWLVIEASGSSILRVAKP